MEVIKTIPMSPTWSKVREARDIFVISSTSLILSQKGCLYQRLLDIFDLILQLQVPLETMQLVSMDLYNAFSLKIWSFSSLYFLQIIRYIKIKATSQQQLFFRHICTHRNITVIITNISVKMMPIHNHKASEDRNKKNYYIIYNILFFF